MRVLPAFLAVAVMMPAVLMPRPVGAEAVVGDRSVPGIVPTVAEAMAKAQESGEPVEVGALRGESRQVHVEPDGSLVNTQYVEPQWAHKAGEWAEVDTTLRFDDEGDVRPVASTANVQFTATGAGAFARIGRAGKEVSFRWLGRMPRPTLEGDTARYAEVLPGVDLLLRAFPDGFAKTLVIKTRQAAANPELDEIDIHAEGDLQVVDSGEGTLEIRDPHGGGTVFESARPMMWDSTGTTGQASGEDGGAGDSGPLAEGPSDGSEVASVGTQLSGQTVTLRPDQAMLDDPETEFPVYVDPQYKTARTTDGGAWAMISSGYPNTSYWKFKGKKTEGVGKCERAKDRRCGRKNQTKRLLFRFPHKFYKGRKILKAEFVAQNTHSYNCSDDRSVRLWRINRFTKKTTWRKHKDKFTTMIGGREISYCSKTPVEWGGSRLRSHVQGAANKGFKTISFGLRAYSESSMAWWKRFTKKAYLRVWYNTPPAQPLMKHLTSNPGGACSYNSALIGVLPQMQARLFDKDRSSPKKLYAQFGVGWDHDGDGGVSEQWRSAKVGPKTTGSLFRLKIPGSIGMPQNQRAYWKVRAWDGHEWSPWSLAGKATGCYFTWDPEHPKPPSISSGDYPESDPDNPDDPWHDGVGTYGAFTIDSASSDTAKYRIGINGDPTSRYERRPSSPGGPVTIRLYPEHAGLNFITAQAFDEVGNTSGVAVYHFRVAAGRPAKAAWALDDSAGSSQVADSTGVFNATVHGGATLGVRGISRTSLRLDGGTGYAETGGPIVDTRKGFAIAAWARLTSADRYAAIASQSGNQNSGFQLYYSPGQNKWMFHKHDADSGGWNGPAIGSDDPPQIGKWTHLLGVFDEVTRELSLYVNGKRQASTNTQDSLWNATGRFQIGRRIYQGAYGNYFSGDLDDVKVFDRVVSAEEAKLLGTQHPQVRARWKFNESDSDTATTPDDGPNGHTLQMSGEAMIFDGLLGNPPGGLFLDGSGDRASASGPVLRTDESFTVTGWVTSPGRPTRAATVFSQHGSTHSGFVLRYHPDVAGGAGGYQLEIPDGDTSAAAMQTTEHGEYAADQEWDHVAVVYDAFERQMRLYVNGQLEQIGDGVSWRNNTLPINAAGPFEIGRSKKGGRLGEYWSGMIDDVWAVQGILTDKQIQKLSLAIIEWPTEPGGP